jgi:hypothetical protein
MRTVLLSLAVAIAAASPALANEARVEGRAGVVWGNGDTEAIAGAAAGYDVGAGPAFVGGEVSADKILEGGTKVGFGFTGRVGANVSPVGKLYANGGYTTEFCDNCGGQWHAGAGYQHSFGGPLYGKVEYRHYFRDNAASTDFNSVGAGIGVRF